MDTWKLIRPPIYVCSRHPLAFGAIKKTLASAAYEVRALEQVPVEPMESQNWILILDTCSVENWTKIATQWNLRGGCSIVLVPKRLGSREEESRFLYLGIHAIVLVPNIDNELLHAVHAVAEGRLWIGRETLDAYIKRTRPTGNFLESRSFTYREHQIIPFLMMGSSNKDIANVLRISDRTVKFHVSNILRKFNVKTRKALREVTTAEEPIAEAASA